MLDSLNELDRRASEWTRSSTARALGRIGLGAAVAIWIVFAIVLTRHDGNFDSLLVKVLFGLSFLALIVVMSAVLHSGSSVIPDAEGKNPLTSAVATFAVVGGIFFVLEIIRTSAPTAFVRSGVFGALAGAARYFHVWRANR